MIDLRSDTITKPTAQMRQAMAEADVGDDVYGEDPSVNRLQELAQELTGKEDALFVASGTMGNQLAVLTHTSPGTEVILEADSHIYYYEAAAASAFAGVQPRPLVGIRGALEAELVEGAIRGPDIHLPPTSLICLENTHNRAGGAVISFDQMKAVYQVTQKHNLPLHLDGARIFNAAVATGVPVKEYTALTTSVQFCLSKGLGAPVGSILAGSKDFITEARRWRKRLGGGMRQAGVIAAAGIVALKTMVERLAEDHENAHLLAAGLAEIKGLQFNFNEVETNIIVARPTLVSAEYLVSELEKRNILASVFEPDQVRFVTSFAVGSKDMADTIQAVREILK